MQIQPITEEAHNTAMLTIIAERQELLYYRTKVVEYEKVIATQKQEIDHLLTKADELLRKLQENGDSAENI